MNSDQTLSDEARVYALALTAQEMAALAGVPPPPEPLWSDPVSLVSTHGRVALGNRVHVVGHNGSSLVHRSSQDNGVTWSAPTVVAAASAITRCNTAVSTRRGTRFTC